MCMLCLLSAVLKGLQSQIRVSADRTCYTYDGVHVQWNLRSILLLANEYVGFHLSPSLAKFVQLVTTGWRVKTFMGMSLRLSLVLTGMLALYCVRTLSVAER